MMCCIVLDSPACLGPGPWLGQGPKKPSRASVKLSNREKSITKGGACAHTRLQKRVGAISIGEIRSQIFPSFGVVDKDVWIVAREKKIASDQRGGFVRQN
jgi:hypothetical protein